MKQRPRLKDLSCTWKTEEVSGRFTSQTDQETLVKVRITYVKLWISIICLSFLYNSKWNPFNRLCYISSKHKSTLISPDCTSPFNKSSNFLYLDGEHSQTYSLILYQIIILFLRKNWRQYMYIYICIYMCI